jgi:hypothetical protein
MFAFRQTDIPVHLQEMTRSLLFAKPRITIEELAPTLLLRVVYWNDWKETHGSRSDAVSPASPVRHIIPIELAVVDGHCRFEVPLKDPVVNRRCSERTASK